MNAPYHAWKSFGTFKTNYTYFLLKTFKFAKYVKLACSIHLEWSIDGFCTVPLFEIFPRAYIVLCSEFFFKHCKSELYIE